MVSAAGAARSDVKAVCEIGVTGMKKDCDGADTATVELMIASGGWAVGRVVLSPAEAGSLGRSAQGMKPHFFSCV